MANRGRTVVMVGTAMVTGRGGGKKQKWRKKGREEEGMWNGRNAQGNKK